MTLYAYQNPISFSSVPRAVPRHAQRDVVAIRHEDEVDRFELLGWATVSTGAVVDAEYGSRYQTSRIEPVIALPHPVEGLDPIIPVSHLMKLPYLAGATWTIETYQGVLEY